MRSATLLTKGLSVGLNDELVKDALADLRAASAMRESKEYTPAERVHACRQGAAVAFPSARLLISGLVTASLICCQSNSSSFIN